MKNLKKISNNDEMIHCIEDFHSNSFNINPITKRLLKYYLEHL